MGIQGFVKIRENSWLAEQGFWGEAPTPQKPLFALPLFGYGFASLGMAKVGIFWYDARTAVRGRAQFICPNLHENVFRKK